MKLSLKKHNIFDRREQLNLTMINSNMKGNYYE